MVTERGQSASLEELDRVMCRVVPVLSAEERAALVLGSIKKSWPWFKLEEEKVSLEQASSRWFLAGRAIANYECR
jgi:hypothetical protein